MNIRNPNTSPYFSINDYDKDGDPIQVGYFLHFGDSNCDTRIFIGEKLEDLETLADNIRGIVQEIRENY